VTPRSRSIWATLFDAAAVIWSAFVLLTFAWPACSFAVVTLLYVFHARRQRWLVKDERRINACRLDMIKRLDEALSKCTRGRSKLKLIKRVQP
jgi:hypothetical protein